MEKTEKGEKTESKVCVTGNGSGSLNVAIIGGAILPLVQAAIADHTGIHHAFFVLVIW